MIDDANYFPKVMIHGTASLILGINTLFFLFFFSFFFFVGFKRRKVGYSTKNELFGLLVWVGTNVGPCRLSSGHIIGSFLLRLANLVFIEL